MHTKKPETLKEEVIRSFQCLVTIAELGRSNSLNVKERVLVKGEVTKVSYILFFMLYFYLLYNFYIFSNIFGRYDQHFDILFCFILKDMGNLVILKRCFYNYDQNIEVLIMVKGI